MIILSGVSGSFFTDFKTSLGNTFTAAAEFPTPPPSTNLTPSPTPTVTPAPVRQEALLYISDPYTCTDGASDLSLPQLTNVVLTNDGTNIAVTVTLTGATASSTYDIWINQDPGGCPLSSTTGPGAIITDESGNGTGTASSILIPGATKFWISAVGGSQVLRSSAVSF